MKRLSKTLAVFLCLAMLISCIPGVVFTAKATEATITQPQGVSIVENYDSYVGEDWVAQLGMPAKVTTSDGEADVQWADATKYVDLKTPGYYFVPGTVNGVAQAVYFPVQVREYENLASAYYGGSFENKYIGWAWNDPVANYAPGFVTDPVCHGEYAAYQIVQSTRKDNAATDHIYSHANWNYSNILPPVVAEKGAGDYYFGFSVMRGEDTVDANATASSLSALVVLDRTTVEYTSGSASFEQARRYRDGKFIPVSDTEWTKIGLTGYLDGTDKHFQFKLTITGQGHANDRVYVDNFELVPLKLALTEVPPVITGVTSEIPAYSVIKDYDTYAGENWKEVLGLPAEVDVTLDNGGTGKASVEWDYSKLNLTTPGWYVLPGKVTSDDYVMKADMTVQQVIKVTEYDNLLANNAHVCNFEKTKTDGGFTLPEYWPVNKLSGAYPFDAAATKQVQSKVPNGGNAFMFTPTAYRSDILYSGSTVRFLGKEIYALGAGQYHFSINAWSDNENGSVMFLRVKTHYGAYSGENNTNGSSTTPTTQCWANILVDNRVTLTSDVQQPSVIASIDTTDASKSDIDYVYVEVDYTKMTDGAFYLDELCVLPLKIELAEVPAMITEVTSTMTTLSVIKDYDTYAGADWQTALALPAQVDVALSDNTTGKADVTWDFSTLDVSKLGRYVVTGTVSSEEYIITDELTVEQVIYIQEYENLLKPYNGDFESLQYHGTTKELIGILYWTCDGRHYDVSGLKLVENPGSGNAIMVPIHKNKGEVVTSGSSSYTRGYYYQNTYLGGTGEAGLTAAVKELGVGQYWMAIDSWTDDETVTTTFRPHVYAYYESGKSVSYSGNKVTYSTTSQTASGIVNIDSMTKDLNNDGVEVELSKIAFQVNRGGNCYMDNFYLDNAILLPLKLEMPNLVEPTIKNASLALQNNLAIKYTALADKFGTDFTDPYVVFTMNGEETTVEGVADGDSYVFWFKNIAPHEIADNITATLHATFNGADVVLDTRDYSVLTYCKNKLGKETAELDTLLADLINYGVELQKALGQEPLDTTELDLSAATATDRELVSKLQFVGEPDNAATWKSASLILNDAVTVRLTFKTELDISNVTVEIQAAGNTWNLVPVKDESAENTYYVDFNGLNAAQMSEEIYAKVNDGDTAVSCALLYSVETYAYNKQATNLGNLVKAMMKYGDSAAAYAS